MKRANLIFIKKLSIVLIYPHSTPHHRTSALRQTMRTPGSNFSATRNIHVSLHLENIKKENLTDFHFTRLFFAIQDIAFLFSEALFRNFYIGIMNFQLTWLMTISIKTTDQHFIESILISPSLRT